MKTTLSESSGNRVFCTLLAVLFVLTGLGLSPFADVAYALGEDYEYSEHEGEATITRYIGSDTSVMIPDTLDGFPVTVIGAAAFAENAFLTEVTIPDSVTDIGAEAFYDTGLTELVIPGNVAEIGASAFASCSNLSSVTFLGDAPQTGDDVWEGASGAFQIYYFADKNGWSQPEWRGYPSAAIPAALPDVSISSVTATDSGSIQVTWNAVPEASGYEVYCAESQNDFELVIITNDTSFIHNNLSQNTTYYYRVRAYVDAGGQRIYGSHSSEEFAWTGLAAPVLSVASAGPGSNRLTWNHVTGASGYEVYCAKSQQDDYVRLISTSGTSFAHNNLSGNTTYYYKIRAYVDTGGQTDYGWYSSEKSARTGLTAPMLSVASTGYKSNRLTWEAISGAEGYEIFRAASAAGTYRLIANITNGKTATYNDNGLTTGQAYFYKMRAYCTSGGKKVYSGYSAMNSRTALPSQPGLKATSASYRSIRLTWSKVAGASGYEVYRATSRTGAFKRVKTTTATVFTNSSLKTGTNYFYKVRAYRTVNRKKIYSGFSTVSTAAPLLPAPAFVSASAVGHNSSSIKWTRVTPASGYEVYRATSPNGSYKKIYTARSRRTLSLTNKNLATGVTYYYKVRAYRKVGSKTAYSQFTPVKTAQPLPAKTTGVKLQSPAENSVKITWASAPGATGYEVYEATSKSSTYALVRTTTARSFTKSGLDPDETYFYKVRAYSQVGNIKVYGPFSNTVPELLSLSAINKEVSRYGKMTVAGMKPEHYRNAVSTEWKRLSTIGDPIEYEIDLLRQMNYSEVQKYILNLGRYEGIDVYTIGKSVQNRDIHMIKLDLGDPAQEKPVIMITGGVHAREFGGTDYSIKFINDTIRKAQTDPDTRSLLEQAVIVVVPLVNPDGREMIIRGGTATRKSNANGVDLNRNMPSMNAGQLAKGVKMISSYSSKPSMSFFAGYNLGSESETRALIKWLNHYAPKAHVFIDLHQQGGITFYNKGFVTKELDARSRDYAIKNNALLKNGYPLRAEVSNYGLNGSGGTFTDYAESVAEGCVFSFKYGRMTLNAGGKEMPLLGYKDIDNQRAHYRPRNTNFRSITVEIGRGSSTGAGTTARQNRKNEYEKYGWEDFLTGTIKIALDIK